MARNVLYKKELMLFKDILIEFNALYINKLIMH